MRFEKHVQEALKALREQGISSYFAFYDYERSQCRRDRRWEARTRLEPPFPPEEVAARVPEPLDAAILNEAEARVAAFERENKKLMKAYERTPTGRKRERRQVRMELLARLLDDGIINHADFIILSTLGPRTRCRGLRVRVVKATA